MQVKTQCLALLPVLALSASSFALESPSTLSTEDKQALLDAHNNYRSQTALGKIESANGLLPYATNMNALLWDDGLAQVARDYASKAVWEHNANRSVDLQDNSTLVSFELPSNAYVGENLYLTSALARLEGDFGLLGGIDSWMDESRDWVFGDNGGQCSGVCGHMTQIVWAKTRYVGCGFYEADSFIEPHAWSKTILVCNYYPGGNFNGQAPYQASTAEADIASNCDADRTALENGLCGGGVAADFATGGREVSQCDNGLGQDICIDEPTMPMTIATLLEEHIIDDNLKSCINELSIENNWTQADEVVDLDCRNSEIITLNGIELLRSLSYLNLGGNDINDLGPLEALTELEELQVWQNPLTELSSLSKLSSLRALSVDVNGMWSLQELRSLTQIDKLHIGGYDELNMSIISSLDHLSGLGLWSGIPKELSLVSNLSNLEELSLYNYGSPNLNNIRALDMADLKGLDKLTGLFFSIRNIINIDEIANFTNLKQLRATGSNIFNISALSNLSSLLELDLGGNQVSSIDALSNLSSLLELDLGGNQVSNIDALSNLSSLLELDLGGNQVSNINALSNLNSLLELDLRGNQVSNIDALSNLSSLIELDLRGNQLSNIDALSHLKSLGKLRLGETNIVNIRALEGLSKLTYLDLNENRISDISALAHLSNLEGLTLYNNEITDLDALSDLSELTLLELDWNIITDVSPLKSLTKLEFLGLSDNNISDLRGLSNLYKKVTINVQQNPAMICADIIITTGEELFNGLPEFCWLSNATDLDDDGVGYFDNCPLVANPGQWDKDQDGLGNACDLDIDGDGFSNEEEENAGSKVWDVKSTPETILLDEDGDGVSDMDDNCTSIANAGQWDKDQDGLGNECDDDIDGDGVSNAQELADGTKPWDPLSFLRESNENDIDGDGILNADDNCIAIANAGQWDKDQDNIGNECDDDIDGDGFTNQQEIAAGTKVWSRLSFPQ